MTDLNSYGYDSETRGFWSHTEQINWHIDRFRDANEAALDRNTAAITAQTEQQRIDADLLRQTIDRQTEQQKSDAEAGRNVFSDWMNNLVTRIKTIFSKDDSDNETSYYEMMESEQKRMQAYVSAHTSTVKQTGDTMNTKLQDIITQLEEMQATDTTNSQSIRDAIDALELINNNYNTNNNIVRPYNE